MALATKIGSNMSEKELLEAQSHVWNHVYNYINSMSLKCAIQLGIPEAIHKHGHPITLSQLADSLSITVAKSDALRRLMRLLVHSKFFDLVKVNVNVKDEEEDEEGYWLTGASRLLLRHEPLSMVPFALIMLDPISMDPWHHMSEWFRDENSSSFKTKHGIAFWEYRLNALFNEGMASDARIVSSIVSKDCRHIFEGLKSMVDVGGGTGATARGVAVAFPGLKCVVLDLPHVVDGLEGSQSLSFVGGDMFRFIPNADAVFLKWILHDWSDEDCVKILEKCKEAINEGGKVILVEFVVEDRKEDKKATETQLFFDMLMMVVINGKERTEKEWAKLFVVAGFSNYSIRPTSIVHFAFGSQTNTPFIIFLIYLFHIFFHLLHSSFSSFTYFFHLLYYH